mmetsp:Transcript_30435/g.55689  ORF Transcript_30435/g.55689 Transcript_30435/m.55689 type:complete len:214 (+) Transcript_30435:1235-1876(+)
MGGAAGRLQRLHFRVLPHLGRQLVDQPQHGALMALGFGRHRRAHAGSTRVLNILLPGHGCGHIGRQITPGAEQVHLHGQRFAFATVVQHILQRRVGNNAAIPVGFTFNHHRREGGWQSTAGHDVLGADALMVIIEIHRVAGAHLHRPHRETHRFGVDPVEIHQPLERAPQRCRVVIADGGISAMHLQGRRRKAWHIETRHTKRHRDGGIDLMK